jgi:type VI secretion system protein ImpH
MQSNIIEFVGEWLPIGEEHQCKLREAYYARQLGVNTSLGKNSWQSQYKFQVQLGPLSLNEYEKVLPGRSKLKRINETIKNYMRDEIQWEIILLLKKAEIPITTIGKYGHLGWTSWLKTEALTHNASLPMQKKNFVGNIRLHCDQIT